MTLSLLGCKTNGEDSKAEADKAKENDFPRTKPNNRKIVFPVNSQKQPQATLKANQPLPKIH